MRWFKFKRMTGRLALTAMVLAPTSLLAQSPASFTLTVEAVSYTHLDVYKRQPLLHCIQVRPVIVIVIHLGEEVAALVVHATL